MIKNKSILVLGGTGAMGSYLVHELSFNYNLIVTSRKERISSKNIKYVKGNAHSLDFIRNLILKERFYAIIDFMNYSTSEFKSRIDLFLKYTEQYFFISSARVYANTTVPITENNSRLLDISTDKRFLSTDDYALAKARQEDILKSSKKKNWTIIRPYMSYFYNRLDLGYFSKEQWLYRVLKGKMIVFPKDVANSLTTLTHGKDVARSIASLVGKDEAKGEIFHITLDNSYKWKDVLNVYMECLKKKGYDVHIKYLDNAIIKDNYIYCYDRKFDRVFDNTKIKKFIDTTDFVDTKEGIVDCVDKFLCNPVFDKLDWIHQAFIDRITCERTKLSEITSYKDKLKYFIFRNIISYKLVHDIYQRIK